MTNAAAATERMSLECDVTQEESWTPQVRSQSHRVRRRASPSGGGGGLEVAVPVVSDGFSLMGPDATFGGSTGTGWTSDTRIRRRHGRAEIKVGQGSIEMPTNRPHDAPLGWVYARLVLGRLGLSALFKGVHRG